MLSVYVLMVFEVFQKLLAIQADLNWPDDTVPFRCSRKKLVQITVKPIDSIPCSVGLRTPHHCSTHLLFIIGYIDFRQQIKITVFLAFSSQFCVLLQSLKIVLSDFFT